MAEAAHRAPVRVEVLPDPEGGPVTPDGPLRSVQEAEVSLSAERLQELWRPETLERLARSYWRYLERISLGLLKIGYGPTGRFVVLGWRRFVLLRFRPPVYDVGAGFGRVTWPIEKGVLVARPGRGRGYLRIDVQKRLPVVGQRRCDRSLEEPVELKKILCPFRMTSGCIGFDEPVPRRNRLMMEGVFVEILEDLSDGEEVPER